MHAHLQDGAGSGWGRLLHRGRQHAAVHRLQHSHTQPLQDHETVSVQLPDTWVHCFVDSACKVPCCKWLDDGCLHRLTIRLLPCSTDKCVIASSGCQTDMATLFKTLQSRNVMFMHSHGKPMSCRAAAQLLSNTLYHKRFFPYYTFNLCAGLDEEGEGHCWTSQHWHLSDQHVQNSHSWQLRHVYGDPTLSSSRRSCM